MSEEVIRLEHVVKHYGSHKVLKDVNLTIDRGEIYGIVKMEPERQQCSRQF